MIFRTGFDVRRFILKDICFFECPSIHKSTSIVNKTNLLWWDKKSSSRRWSFLSSPMILFCLSNTTSVLSRCTKIFLYCIPLLQQTSLCWGYFCNHWLNGFIFNQEASKEVKSQNSRASLNQSHERLAVATTRGRFHHHIGRSRVELGMHPILW